MPATPSTEQAVSVQEVGRDAAGTAGLNQQRGYSLTYDGLGSKSSGTMGKRGLLGL